MNISVFYKTLSFCLQEMDINVDSLTLPFRYSANICGEAVHIVLMPIPDLLNRRHLVEISLFHKALENFLSKAFPELVKSHMIVCWFVQSLSLVSSVLFLLTQNRTELTRLKKTL